MHSIQWRSTVRPSVSYFAIILMIIFCGGLTYYAHKVLTSYGSIVSAQTYTLPTSTDLSN